MINGSGTYKVIEDLSVVCYIKGSIYEYGRSNVTYFNKQQCLSNESQVLILQCNSKDKNEYCLVLNRNCGGTNLARKHCRNVIICLGT